MNVGLLGMPCPQNGTEVGVGLRGYWVPMEVGLVSVLHQNLSRCPVGKGTYAHYSQAGEQQPLRLAGYLRTE